MNRERAAAVMRAARRTDRHARLACPRRACFVHPGCRAKVEVRVARMLAAWGARTMFALGAPPAFAPFATFAPLTPPAFLSTMVAISQTVFAPVPALALGATLVPGSTWSSANSSTSGAFDTLIRDV